MAQLIKLTRFTRAVISAAAVLAASVFVPAFVAVPSAGDPEGLVVLDLWDYPAEFSTIYEEGPALFFICDLGAKECREGAVFFESRAANIREAGVQPIFLFRGDPAVVRSTVLSMNLDTPVYIDRSGDVIDGILEQEVLPALMLAAPDGTGMKTVYGGGDSLAGNIERILLREEPESPPPRVAEPTAGPEEKRKATYKLLLGAAAVIIIGVLILAN